MELAIRMAILETAAHRIGRLPLILDDALDGFHGQTLDHVVRVLIEFARDGQQVLLMTGEQEVAQRVRVHHGWVAYLNQSPSETDAIPPSSYRESPYVIPMRPAIYREPSPSLSEVNAQLSAASRSYPFGDVQPAIVANGPIPYYRVPP